MNENEIDKNDVRKNNIRVFWIGTVLVVLISLTLTCVALDSFVYNYRNANGERITGGYFTDEISYAAFGGPITVLGVLVIWYIAFILGVVFIQICMYFGVRVFTSLNKVISGIKMLIFYAIELVVAFMPFLIIWASNHV